MTLENFGAFCLASIFLAYAPGPDNLFVCSQAALYGVRQGVLVVLGLCSGLVVQTVAAALGIAAVVAACDVLFWSVRLLGAAYLFYLAAMAWRHPYAVGGQACALSGWRLWRRGLIMNITNPKVEIFFLAFFPQFITPGADARQTALEMTILGVAFLVITLCTFGSIALAAGKVASRLRSPRFQLYLNRGSALLFVFLALATVFSGK